MDHPWRRLRSLPEWDLHWRVLDGVLGLTDFAAQTITLDPRQLQAQRRSTLAHELEHVARGSAHGADISEEKLVEAAAARRLIEIHELGEALAWAQDEHEAADELWVDVALLRARLASLETSEHAYLRQRLGICCGD